MDKETGLYNYGARYYDPSLSIWTGVDPLADQFPAYSPYNYTLNNPINMIDPDGRAAVGVNGDPPGYAHQEVKRRIENVAKAVSEGFSSFANSVTSFFGGSSTAVSVTETLTDAKTDTPNFNGKGIVNKGSKILGPVMTGVSIMDSYGDMDPNDPASVKQFEQSATADVFGLIPVLGPGVSSVIENSMDPEGTFNLDNNKMSDGYSSGINATKNMTSGRVRQRQMDAARREANYTPEQKRKMKLRSSDSGYQKALRGG